MMPQYLGKDRYGNYYILEPDLYVYQYGESGACYGWLCSYPAWENTMHKIINDKSASCDCEVSGFTVFHKRSCPLYGA